MSKKIKLNKELIDVLKTKRIIVVVGSSDSGKTTEASEIAFQLGKPVYVVIQKKHSPDTKIFDSLGFNKIIVGSEEQIKQKISVALRNVKDSTIIFDDFHSAERSCKEYIDKKLLNFLKKEKKNLRLILNYHPQHIPMKFLNEDWSILLLKRNSNMSSERLGKYLIKKLIATPTEEKAETIKDYSTLYLLKDGMYFYRDSNTYVITKGEIIPKSCINLSQDEKENICESVLNGITQKELSVKYNVSKTTIHNIIKEKCERDSDYQKSYTKTRNQKRVGSFNRIANRKSTGLTLTIIEEKLYIDDDKLVDMVENSLGKDDETSDKNTDFMRQVSQKLTNVENWKDLQNKGDFAVRVIGEGIYDALCENVSLGVIKFADLIIRLCRGGVDITIVLEDKQIEIEVKNYKPTKKYPNLTKTTIKREIVGNKKDKIEIFSKQATDKWVFTCGRGITDSGKRLLTNKGIGYKRLCYTQLKKKETNKKYHIKQRMKKFVSSII